MYSPGESLAVQSQARELKFQRLDPAEALGNLRLHVYGGGLLNRFWGTRRYASWRQFWRGLVLNAT